MYDDATVKQPRWNIHKTVHGRRWVLWNPGWLDLNWPPLQFDTWQQAIDYANARLNDYDDVSSTLAAMHDMAS